MVVLTERLETAEFQNIQMVLLFALFDGLETKRLARALILPDLMLYKEKSHLAGQANELCPPRGMSTCPIKKVVRLS